MASNHTADPATFYNVISMLDGSDVMSATQLRAIFEKLHDNTANLQARHMPASVLRPRTLQQFGDTVDDAQDCLAAIGFEGVTMVLTANTNGVLYVGDSDYYRLHGAFVTIHVGAAADAGGLRAAYSGSRVVVTGMAGAAAESEYSDDSGATWNDGGQFSATAPCDWLLWDEVNSLFVGVGGSTLLKTTPDGVTWSANIGGTSNTRSEIRVAALAAGPLIGMTSAGVVRISDDTTTWADAAGAIPLMAQMTSLADKGCLAGARETFYHVGRVTAGLQVSSSPDGDTWTTLATITPADAGLTDFESAAPRILQCPQTGLLVIATPANAGSFTALFASLDGETWVGPAVISGEFDPDFVAVANGKVFVKFGAQILGSDGL